jgi:hypothetical protein
VDHVEVAQMFHPSSCQVGNEKVTNQQTPRISYSIVNVLCFRNQAIT